MKDLALVALSLSLFASGCASTRIGVIADPQVGWITETRNLEKAFRFYRANEVDAVVIAGQATKNGYRNQDEVLQKVWRKVFAGTPTRLIVGDGRQEVNGFVFAVSSNRPSAKCDVLTFYGTDRRALTDELCYYPRERNAVCAGSMSGVHVPEGSDEKLVKSAARAAQGLLVTAGPSSVEMRRLEFAVTDRKNLAEDVAEPWTVGPAEAVEPAPEFWSDTRLRVRRGQDAKGGFLVLEWPNVLKRGTGVRARHYEVDVAFADHPDYPFLRRRVLSPNFFLAESRDMGGASCTFRSEELPVNDQSHTHVVFSVVPVGSLGKRGKAFKTDPVPLR